MTSCDAPEFPKVLLVTRNHPPLQGGMERLNAKLFRALLDRNAKCGLLGPPGASSFVPEGAATWELSGGPLPLMLLSSLTRGVGVARRLRPRVVLGGSGLAAPAVVAAASSVGAVPMIYLHGLDIVARNSIYRTLWLPCIRRCHSILVNSANTRRLAVQAGVVPERIRIVHPGTEIPSQDFGARERFRSRHGFDESQPLLLSVGRITQRKGMAEFIARVLPIVHARLPSVRLVVIGDEAPNALHRGRGDAVQRMLEAIAASGLDNVVRWLGPRSDEELAEAYQAVDLHVFPGREVAGDVEGFGMVAIEAAAHGLPTIAFNVGGVSDAVEDGKSGRLIKAGDDRAFAEAVVLAVSKHESLPRTQIREFASGFSWDRFGREVAKAVEAIA